MSNMINHHYANHASDPAVHSLGHASAIRDILVDSQKQPLGIRGQVGGFVSLETGFASPQQLNEVLPGDFRHFDNAIQHLPEWYANCCIRSKVDELKIDSTSTSQLSVPQLVRLNCILGFLAHGYINLDTGIQLPSKPFYNLWKHVSQKELGRREAFLNYEDLIACNWRFKSCKTEFQYQNLELMFPVTGGTAEKKFYLAQTQILYTAKFIVRELQRIETSQYEETVVVDALDVMRVSFQRVLKALKSLTPLDKHSGLHPVIWSKVVAPFAVPPPNQKAPGPSGTACFLFHVLDLLLDRHRYDSELGQEARLIRKYMPHRHQSFLRAVDGLNSALPKSSNVQLAKQRLLDVYAGENGFLGAHGRKATGLMEIAFRVGREQTIGGFQGDSESCEWREVDDELKDSKAERIGCPFIDQNKKRNASTEKMELAKSTRAIFDSELGNGTYQTGKELIAINGCVVDISQFATRHPGGAAILWVHAGTDASESFSRFHAINTILAREELVVGRRVPIACPHYGKLSNYCWQLNRWQNTLRLEEQAIEKQLVPACAKPNMAITKLRQRLLSEVVYRAIAQYIPVITKFSKLDTSFYSLPSANQAFEARHLSKLILLLEQIRESVICLMEDIESGMHQQTKNNLKLVAASQQILDWVQSQFLNLR